MHIAANLDLLRASHLRAPHKQEHAPGGAEFFVMGEHHGLSLPGAVLEHILRTNALKWLAPCLG